jgi:hypothetical protein
MPPRLSLPVFAWQMFLYKFTHVAQRAQRHDTWDVQRSWQLA